MYLESANMIHWEIAAVNAMAVAVVCYFVGRIVGRKH